MNWGGAHSNVYDFFRKGKRNRKGAEITICNLVERFFFRHNQLDWLCSNESERRMDSSVQKSNRFPRNNVRPRSNNKSANILQFRPFLRSQSRGTWLESRGDASRKLFKLVCFGSIVGLIVWLHRWWRSSVRCAVSFRRRTDPGRARRGTSVSSYVIRPHLPIAWNVDAYYRRR